MIIYCHLDPLQLPMLPVKWINKRLLFVMSSYRKCYHQLFKFTWMCKYLVLIFVRGLEIQKASGISGGSLFINIKESNQSSTFNRCYCQLVWGNNSGTSAHIFTEAFIFCSVLCPSNQFKLDLRGLLWAILKTQTCTRL